MPRTLIAALAALALVAVAAVSACGGSSDTGKTDTFTVKVTGDKADQTDLQANQGDTIKLTITTDKDEEVHLHGFDIAFECKAGEPLTKTFKADRTGQFEYEIEDSSTHLGNLTVKP
jgi:hypothetical protein